MATAVISLMYLLWLHNSCLYVPGDVTRSIRADSTHIISVSRQKSFYNVEDLDVQAEEESETPDENEGNLYDLSFGCIQCKEEDPDESDQDKESDDNEITET
eukprot:15364599-Ditylum_brightwellii.AAC.2